MDDRIILNAANIMSDKYAALWNELISKIDDNFIKRVYLKDISEKEVREDVLRKIGELSSDCHLMPTSFKLFLIHLSYDLYFGPEWFAYFLDYYKNAEPIPTGVMYPKLLKYAALKEISAKEFFDILDKVNNDYSIIEERLINYNSVQCVDAIKEDNSIEPKTATATIYDALLQVLSTADQYNTDAEIENINNIISSQRVLTDNLSLSVNGLIDIIKRQKEDIRKLNLSSATKNEVIKSLQEQNDLQKKEIESLKEKIISYEKKEISRVNLTHKLAEFSGLINEIDKSNVITVN